MVLQLVHAPPIAPCSLPQEHNNLPSHPHDEEVAGGSHGTHDPRWPRSSSQVSPLVQEGLKHKAASSEFAPSLVYSTPSFSTSSSFSTSYPSCHHHTLPKKLFP